MERIRLQRKFNIKSKVEPTERLGLILQMMVLFWLALIGLNSILTFSFRVHVSQVFTAQFWTSEHTINANLSLAICTLLLLPYLIFWIEVPGSATKDFVSTALTLHSIIAFVINFKITLKYLLFVSLLGVIGSILGTYGARIREQAKLIREIQNIEMSDRNESHGPVQQSEHSQLRLPD